MDKVEEAAYYAVYQAYSWAQGATDHAVEFRIPDEYFYIHPEDKTGGFDLEKFFSVVADVDDGGIHYWELRERQGDRYLMLACTEDDSMRWMGSRAEDFRTAAAMLDYLRDKAE